jgi:hypothetical protein
MTVVEQIYLECINGYSFKFFSIALIEDGGLWSCLRTHGPIGGPMDRWSPKVSGVSEAKARAAFASLMREKARHGYEPDSDMPRYIAYR